MRFTKLFFSVFAMVLVLSNVTAQDNSQKSVGPAPYQRIVVPPSDNNQLIGTRVWYYLSMTTTFQFGKGFLEACTQTNLGTPFSVTFPGALTNKAGTILMNNQSSPFQVYSIDTTSGIHTLLFSCTGVPQSNMTGMTWDVSTNTLYGLSTSLAVSQIFTINTTTGVCTPIGTASTVSPGAIFLAANTAGSLFGSDIVNDNLYRWNKTTGAPGLVGPLGFDANFGQDAQFDLNDNVLYYAAYNNTAGAPQLRKVDTTNGSSTLLCTFTAQMTGIAMAAPVPATPPLCEQFTATTFPPTGWTNSNATYCYRSTASGFGLGTGSAVYDYWNGAAGTLIDLTTLTFQSTGAADSIACDMAYNTAVFTGDSLDILASTNGGTTFSYVVRLGGPTLSTTTSGGDPFTPTASQWAKRKYVLPAGTNKLRFHGYSNFGDNCYIDSTCIVAGPSGISHNLDFVPKTYSLSQNYPNPFNPSTQIQFGLPKSGNVKLIVYDILGREVKTLVNEYRTAGTYQIAFDASSLASGVYFYKIEANDFVQTKKMLLVK